MHRIKDYTYEIKCRKCGKITEMYLFPVGVNTEADILAWAVDHASYPIQHKCECGDENNTMLHVISFTLNDKD